MEGDSVTHDLYRACDVYAAYMEDEPQETSGDEEEGDDGDNNQEDENRNTHAVDGEMAIDDNGMSADSSVAGSVPEAATYQALSGNVETTTSRLLALPRQIRNRIYRNASSRMR